MHNSARLAYLMEDAHKSNDLHAAIDAFNDWQMANCYHPQKQRIYDAHAQQYRTVFVPCGSCYHCMETKVNEWVTRMYAHCEDFKHVYFITLTYRSFDFRRPAEKIVLDYLSDAIWHYDIFNSTKHACYSPCLLVKKHYQNFIKRLRYNTGVSDLSYVLCGEYGSEYGRPHFHAVLFSNTSISKQDIDRAWSVALWYDYGSKTFRRKTNQRKNGRAFYVSIGRTDYNDLVTNGTFNTKAKIKVDNNFYSAGRCFAYVCKYICKRDQPNRRRLALAYNGLFKKERFIKLYENEMSFSIARQYLIDHGYPYCEDDSNLLYNKEKLKQLSYEKVIPFCSGTIYPGFARTSERTLFDHVCQIENFPTSYTDFLDKFLPFVEFSRGCPIGSIYANTHLQEFTQGVFNKPILQDTSFVVPSYFRTKARNKLYGLRRLRKTIKGTSYCYGALMDFRRLLEAANSSGFNLPFVVPRWLSSQDYNKLLQDPTYSLKDLSTGERILIINERVKHFKYNRHSRTYDCTNQIPLKDWLSYWCDRLTHEYCFYRSNLERSKESLRLRDRALLLATDLGADSCSLAESFEAQQAQYLSQKQIIYDSLHTPVE